jgi:hypothetical protein
MKTHPLKTLGMVLSVLLAACGNNGFPTAKPTIPPPAAPSESPAADTPHTFVTNTLILPLSTTQSQELALNIDNDPQGTADNMLGRMFSTFLGISPEFELQSTVDEMISTGHVVMLHLVQAEDLQNDTSVQWSIHHGQQPAATPAFNGSDAFTIDNTAPANSMIPGAITNGHFSGGPGSARVQMVFLGVPIEVDLLGVRLEADITANGCSNGRIGGGVSQTDFQATFLPAFADGLNQTIAEDPAAAFSQTVLAAFDGDRNGSITREELQGNLLLGLVTSPDLDLLDASGAFNPNQDGVKDSLSLGLGFTCVPAAFSHPSQ